jgi:hypothetical protein
MQMVEHCGYGRGTGERQSEVAGIGENVSSARKRRPERVAGRPFGRREPAALAATSAGVVPAERLTRPPVRRGSAVLRPAGFDLQWWRRWHARRDGELATAGARRACAVPQWCSSRAGRFFDDDVAARIHRARAPLGGTPDVIEALRASAPTRRWPRELAAILPSSNESISAGGAVAT